MNLIINYCPTGMIPTKDMTPHVPVSVNEIIEDVHQVFEIGITMVHLHARDEITGEPTRKAGTYRKLISGIRKISSDLIITVTTSGRTYSEFVKRAEVLQLEGDEKPDMGSLTLSSLNFNKQTSMNSPEMIKALASEMSNKGILPELEAFDSGMINYAKYLAEKGLIRPPHYFNLILGNISCAQADLLHAGIMINDLPQQSIWSLGAVGDYQLRINSLAIAMNGGVRVGLEGNIWYDQSRTKQATNSDLLKHIHVIGVANERETMKPAELRKILNLESGHGFYGRNK
jgi:3-keto-5-aminohexanoate cleavage enzyme